MPNDKLNHEDITLIFKNNLKIENTVKEISSIFHNERFFARVDYKPYFQRHYVWDNEKASYFIESILLGTEIPPIVLFDNQVKNEVIDGRQRYETIKKFLDGDITLSEDGLKSLTLLSGKTYFDLPKELQEQFEETKIRLLQCSVVNEPELSDEREDKIKKEIFKRYNSGITPLNKEEIQRAQFINDETTNAFERLLKEEKFLYKQFSDIFLPKSQSSKGERDKLNVLLSKVRVLISLPFIPINNYANSSSKSEVIEGYYTNKVIKGELSQFQSEFKSILEKLFYLKKLLTNSKHELKDNALFFECCYWVFAVLEKKSVFVDNSQIENFVNTILSCNDFSIFWDESFISKDILMVFNATGSHYHKPIVQRYKFVANYFSSALSSDFSSNFKDVSNFKKALDNNTDEKTLEKSELEANRIIKSDPTSMTIEDILKKIEKSKFLIRPPYQRSEVKNPKKSSYLLESIMLGIKIPPIFIYKRNDKVSEVVDGQQRLLSIIGFLGKYYLDENNKKTVSEKNKFKLSELKILDDLNGKNIDAIDEKYKNKILDFQLDVVEINAEQNPNFSCLDLFLRLNTKPYPIEPNSFEMWNANVEKSVIIEIRKLAENHCNKVFRAQDKRMKVEELIASLAYIDYKARTYNRAHRDSLNIYIRSGRISSRIKQKADITRELGTIAAQTSSNFHISINNVEEFIAKIYILVNNDITNMNDIFSHKSKYTSGKTDQNFYFLWLLLHNVETIVIQKNHEATLKKVSDFFNFIQNIPADYTIERFFKVLDEFKIL